jgi:hypothetical protein
MSNSIVYVTYPWLLFLGRYNKLGVEEWSLLMKSLDCCTHLHTLNSIDITLLGAGGGKSEIVVESKSKLDEYDLGWALAHYLRRSASTLARLDIRFEHLLPTIISKIQMS